MEFRQFRQQHLRLYHVKADFSIQHFVVVRFQIIKHDNFIRIGGELPASRPKLNDFAGTLEPNLLEASKNIFINETLAWEDAKLFKFFQGW